MGRFKDAKSRDTWLKEEIKNQNNIINKARIFSLVNLVCDIYVSIIFTIAYYFIGILFYPGVRYQFSLETNTSVASIATSIKG